MNRVFVLSEDGRIFSADSYSEAFELLEPNTGQSCESSGDRLQFTKIASCEWGLWTVSSTLQVYLNVFEFDTPCEYQEETYENQRRYHFFSADAFTDRLMFTDRYGFSSADGVVRLEKDGFKLPTDNWAWRTEWSYEPNDSDVSRLNESYGFNTEN